MHPLPQRDLLALAEAGVGLGPAGRALAMLAVGFPDAGEDVIAAAPLSARDRALLALRARAFGHELCAVERCDACGETLELNFRAADLGLDTDATPPFPPAPSQDVPGLGPARALTGADMAAAEVAAMIGGADMAARLLMTAATPNAVALRDAEAVLEALDPAADFELLLECATCGASASRAFDVPRFVIAEIEARVPRILRDVAELACAFHWSEAEILDMPPVRRAFYLSEVRA